MLWIVLLIVGIVVFCFLSCYLIPKLLFKIKLETVLPKGNGQKVITEVFGTTVLYTADKSINKHIHQYILSNRDNKTVLLCEIETSIYYLDYICVCYNSKGKVVKIISVNENIQSRGLTQELELPYNTSQASIVLNKVNEESFKNSFKLKMSFMSILFFGILELLLSIGLLFLIKVCIANSSAGVFAESFIGKPLDFEIYAFVIILAVINVFIIYLSHKTKHVNKGVK